NANKLKDRPKDVPAQKVTHLGVVGAGLMGAGIAYSAALSGIDVVLIDATQEQAEKGKASCAKLVEARVTKGQTTREKADELLKRINPTADYALLSKCTMIVEAVFEDRKVKAEVMKKIDAVVSKEAVIASNTSSLPISSLAESVTDQRSFVGIHFFSP